MNWEAIGVSVVVALALIGFNAWCMKLVIDNAIGKNMIVIMKTFVTKADCDKHTEQCPHLKS